MSHTSDLQILRFSDQPAITSQYLRALLARSRSGTQPFPALEAQLRINGCRSAKVKQYAALCGFAGDSPFLPVTYPHILAFPLHMELLLHKDFPLPLLGLVHIRNRITAVRPISAKETLDIRCFLGEQRKTAKGIEFDVHTDITSGGEPVWQSLSTNFCRQNKTQSLTAKPEAKSEVKPEAKSTESTAVIRDPVSDLYDYREVWQLPSSLGCRYAWVSGDANPIHLSALSARLFGFRRHIVHGMWSKARITAHLCADQPDRPLTVSAQFFSPVFLPATTVLNYCRHKAPAAPDSATLQQGFRFELNNTEATRTHVSGELLFL